MVLMRGQKKPKWGEESVARYLKDMQISFVFVPGIYWLSWEKHVNSNNITNKTTSTSVFDMKDCWRDYIMNRSECDSCSLLPIWIRYKTSKRICCNNIYCGVYCILAYFKGSCVEKEIEASDFWILIPIEFIHGNIRISRRLRKNVLSTVANDIIICLI